MSQLHPDADAFNRRPGRARQSCFEPRRLEAQTGAKSRGIEPDYEFLLALGGSRYMGREQPWQGGLNQVAEFHRRPGTGRKMLQTGGRAVNHVTDWAGFVHCDQVRIEKQVGRKIIVLRRPLGHSLAHCLRANSSKGEGAKLPVYGASYDSGVASLKQELRHHLSAIPVVISRIAPLADLRHGQAGSRCTERAA